MNKTKMIATIGPSSRSKETIKQMILSGVDVIRINMSHSSFEDARDVILKVRELNRELSVITGIMIDTRGPEIRITELEKNKIKLIAGNTIRIVKNNIKGNENMISLTLPEVINYIKVGERILLNDGNVTLEVVSNSSDAIICEIKNDGYIKSNCSVNIPKANFNLKFLSEYDRETIKFAVLMQVDYLALSHVKDQLDVLDVNDLLIELSDDHIQIISKIENKTAIEEMKGILKVSDGVMIARGDLGIETGVENLPLYQQMMISKCRAKGKRVIMATQMMSSMKHSIRPTNAEVTDVANAILSGCDAIMTSDETTMGEYPVETIQNMKRICENVESYYRYDNKYAYVAENKTEIIASSVVNAANELGSKVIVAATMSGHSARAISNLRPNAPILATVPTRKVARTLALSYGVYPVVVNEYDSTDEVINDGVAQAKKFVELNSGDKIVIAGGFPNTGKKTTNFMKIEEI